MTKDFRKCPITESTYIDGVLQETREDNVAASRIILNSMERIQKQQEKEKKDGK